MFKFNIFSGAAILPLPVKSLGEQDREAIDILSQDGIVDVTHLTALPDGFTAELLLCGEPQEERHFFASLYGFYSRSKTGAEVRRSEATPSNPNGWAILFRIWKGDRLVGARFDKAGGSGGYCAVGRGMGNVLMEGLRLMLRYQLSRDPNLHLDGPLSPGAEACWDRHNLPSACLGREALAILSGEPEETPSFHEEEGVSVGCSTMRLVDAWEEGQDEF